MPIASANAYAQRKCAGGAFHEMALLAKKHGTRRSRPQAISKREAIVLIVPINGAAAIASISIFWP